jgi:hypothetical protein
MNALATLISMSKPSIVEVFAMHASETAATNDEMRMRCHLIVNSLWSCFAQRGSNIAIGLFEHGSLLNQIALS